MTNGQLLPLLVMVSCADREEARRIGQALVEEKLAACVHLRPHEAIYRWNGQVEQASEYMLLAKTMPHCYAALQARISALHSYDVPAIAAVAVAVGSQPFLDWIGESVLPPS